MKKRIFSVLLAVSVLASLLIAPVWAAEDPLCSCGSGALSARDLPEDPGADQVRKRRSGEPDLLRRTGERHQGGRRRDPVCPSGRCQEAG